MLTCIPKLQPPRAAEEMAQESSERRSSPFNIQHGWFWVLRILQLALYGYPCHMARIYHKMVKNTRWISSGGAFRNPQAGLQHIFNISLATMIILFFDALVWYGNIYDAPAETVETLYWIGTLLDVAMIVTPAAGLYYFGTPWEWLQQSCVGHAAWTELDDNRTLSPDWKPRDPPQWIDLLGSAKRKGPLAAVHSDCQKLKVFWCFVVFNIILAFLVWVLRTLQLLCLDDPTNDGRLLITNSRKSPGRLHRCVYGLVALYPHFRSLNSQRHDAEKLQKRIGIKNGRLDRTTAQPSVMIGPPKPTRTQRVLHTLVYLTGRESDERPEDLESGLVTQEPPRLPEPAFLPPSPLDAIEEFEWIYRPPSPPHPPAGLADILAHYTVLSSILPKIHHADFLSLLTVSKAVNASIHGACGPSLRVAAARTCGGGGIPSSSSSPRERCSLCKIPICHHDTPSDCSKLILIWSRPHLNCVRICNLCFCKRKCGGAGKQVCKCHERMEGLVCKDDVGCAVRQIAVMERQRSGEMVHKKGCAQCGGRFWSWFRPYQWWVHADENCGRDCMGDVHSAV